MKTRVKKDWKTGLLLSAGALFLFSVPASAGFGSNGDDNAQLMSRINQLENQVQTLSRAVYKGESRPLPMAGNRNAGVPAGVVMSDDDMVSGGGASSGGMGGGYDERINQLEASIRHLTGQVEQMGYDIQQLKKRSASNDSAASYQQQAYQQTAQPPRSDYNRAPANTQTATGGDQPRGKLLGTLSSSGNATDTPGGLYDDAFNDIRDARYDQAAEKFQRFLKTYPSHALAANAQYWLAETYYVRQDYKQGARLFAQNYQDYPKSAKASASLLKLGLSLARLGKKDDACLTFAQLKKEFPGDQTPEVQRAQREIDQLNCKM